MEKEYPKVLVVSINAWRDNSSINTLPQFFKKWDKEKIAQIYTRSVMPSTTVCNRFFQISEGAVLKSIFKRNVKTGRIVENQNAEDSIDLNFENRLYASKRVCSGFLRVCREFVWLLGRWKTKELDGFIDSFDADVLFTTIYPTIFMGRLQKYIIKRSGKPVIAYIADDNYTYKSIKKNPISLLFRAILRKYVKFIVSSSEKLFVISPKQKEEYDQLFNINSEILTKGIDYSGVSYNETTLNKPIKMVYTGKLIIGRWKSLSAIAQALGEINSQTTKITLDIYTTDTLTRKQDKLLNRNGCSVKGAISFEEVKAVQESADVLVFVEGLDKRHKNSARLSFSTKITDYLKSGKCILAIGDKNIAPIDYFIKNDSAIVATDYNAIEKKLKLISENADMILEYGKKAFDCGKRNHDSKVMEATLYNAIKAAKK